jgi:hypothetical protein
MSKREVAIALSKIQRLQQLKSLTVVGLFMAG